MSRFRTRRHGLLRLAGVVCFALGVGCVSGCGESRPVFREQKLPSGKSVKVTALHLAWGAEHDDRFPEQDCFALEFVSANPEAADDAREREAREVFELIRPASEQWGFKTATVAAFPAPARGRQYDLFIFRRGDDGGWTVKRERF